MTARAAATPFATGAPVAPRRAFARRFTFRTDIGAWPLFQRVLWAAGVGAGLLGLLLQAVSGPVAIAVTALFMSLAAVGWRWRRSRGLRPVMPAAFHALRWDGAEWWWSPAASLGSSSAPGAPLAVSIAVLLDLEHWMLLRLTPGDAGWRFWRRHFLPVSRGNCTGDWPLLRIHLFMARD